MKNKRISTIFFSSLFLVFFIIFVYIIIFSINKETPNVSSLVKNGWQYRYGESPVDSSGVPIWIKGSANDMGWSDFTVPGKPINKAHNSEVWVRVPVASGDWVQPTILFMTYDQIFKVYMDNKPIYSFGKFDIINLKKCQGTPWHLIELPSGYGGKYIYLHFYSLKSESTGLIRKFDINNKSVHIYNIVKAGLLTVIFASIFVFVGICSFIIFVIARKEHKVFLYLSVSSITTGIWLLAGGTLKQFLFDAPGFWVHIEITSQYLIPLCFTALMKSLFNSKHEKIFNSIIYISGLLIIISLLLDLLNIVPLVNTLDVFYITFTLEMVTMIVIIFKAFSEWNIEIKIFSSGFTLLCLLGIMDILNWNFNINHSDTYLTQWGMTFFILSLALVLIFDFIKTQKSVEIYSEEVKLKEIIITERKRELEEAMINDKLKTEFISNISHEFRTPLNIIVSSIQLLSLYEKNGTIFEAKADLKKYLEIMKQNSYRLIRLVNNIIDITKIDTGYLELKLENHNIVAVVEDITLSVADYIKSKGISLTFDTDVEEKILACDSDKIERVILNLLSNAVKFSNPGSDIFVDIHDMDSEVVISIEDTGIGMEKDKLNLIFNRFAQVDRSFTRNHEGSGIGLSLVKSLVEMHGGKITVQSEYEKGSKFIITLPARILEDDDKKPEEQEMHAVYVEKVDIEFSDIYS